MSLLPLRTCRRASAILLLSGALLRAHDETLVKFAPVVVSEAPLTADAGGTTQLRLPDATPVATNSLSTVADAIANLQVDASGAGSFGALLSLRGLSNTPYFSDPSVAVYFDDIPLGSAFTYPVDLLGFTSATVHRGPQLSLAGRAAEGGLIVFSSPALRAGPEGMLRAGFGNFRARAGALTCQTGSDAPVAGNIAVGYHAREGFIENTSLHTRVDDQESTSASARFRFQPAPAVHVTAQLLASRQRDGSQPLVPIGGPLFTVARGREGSTDSTFVGEAVKFAFDTPLGPLSATTSHSRWVLDPYDNRLVLPPPLDSRLTQRQSAWNEELRFASYRDLPVSWHAGAWFSDVETSGDVNRAIPGLFPIEGSRYTLATHTAAVFGDVTLRAGPAWRVTGSVRAEQVDKDFAREETVPATRRFTSSRTDAALLPKFTATYQVSADTTASASIGAGRKPGGWSAYTDNPSLARFSPESAVSYEAGVDTWLQRRTLRLAARLFDVEIRDDQIERSFTQTDYLVVNAPRARSRGGELELTCRVLPEFTVSATLGITDVTLRDYADPFTGRSYAGNRAPYAPDVDLHVAAIYRLRGGWLVAADATAIGRVYFDETQDPLTAARAHQTANAQIGYQAARWRIALSAENLADAHYATLVIPGISHQVPGSPRTLTLEAALLW